MVYYYHVSGFQGPVEDDDPTIEEQIEKFDEDIGQSVSAEARAEELFRQSMIARGLDPDVKPELPPELAAKMEEDEMKSDKDIFFGDTTREFRGKPVRESERDFE